ncbi:MAG: DUF1648 domain-containing protein [Bacteroidales bacterium]|jgi:uncharacterized membrane protein|nr:DUF1648 domain-containing protein [Bacteroidales bacterium]HOI32865.1 DUF1648 domain-containing protein [Bacteroidales bacterium]
MNSQPKFCPKPTSGDIQIEWFGYLLLLAGWIFALWAYVESPEEIAVHFNVKGQPDGYGNKITLMVLQLIGTMTFVGLTWLNKFPHIFNYPIKITAENREFQYRLAMRLIRWLKISILLIFLFITFAMYQSARQEEASGMLVWLMPAILAVTFLPLIIYFLNLSPKKSQK